MHAPAIEDHVTTKLFAWYSAVAEWQPPGDGFNGICAECTVSAIACTIDIAAWPHDVIHLLVVSLRSAIADVRESFFEESTCDADCAAARARSAVASILEQHVADIQDVLEQCLSDRLQAYIDSQVAGWDLRRLAAS